MKEKVFVEIVAEYTHEGAIRPLAILWDDGRVFEIDKITDICRAASLKSGGAGIRYTITVKNKQRYLYLDEDHWFIES